MPVYIVTCAYYDCWQEQTVAVKASSVEEACRKAIEKADEDPAEYEEESFPASPTFVAGIADGDKDDLAAFEDDGEHPAGVAGEGRVPTQYSEVGILALRSDLPPDEKKALVDALNCWKTDTYESERGFADAQIDALIARLSS